MPRGFSQIESQRIVNDLIHNGLKMLSISGVRKTTVQTLAKASHISTGEFYAFFPSKEDLFFRVYEELESRLKENFLISLETRKVTGLEGLKQVIFVTMTSEDMQRLVNLIKSDELDYLLRNIEPERISKHYEGDKDYILKVLLQIRDTCPVKQDLDLIISYLQALFILCFEKNKIGKPFEQVLKSFINGMVQDLISNIL